MGIPSWVAAQLHGGRSRVMLLPVPGTSIVHTRRQPRMRQPFVLWRGPPVAMATSQATRAEAHRPDEPRPMAAGGRYLAPSTKTVPAPRPMAAISRQGLAIPADHDEQVGEEPRRRLPCSTDLS